MFIEWESNRIWYQDDHFRKLGLTHVQRMIIVKLEDEYLMVISPIALTAQCQLELSKLGSVKYIVSPTPTYHQHISDWWLAYPDAYFFATHSLIEKRTDLNFDDALSRRTPKQWQGQILQTSIGSDDMPNKVIFCDPSSKTLLMSDNLITLQDHLPLGQKISTLAQGANRQLSLPILDRNKYKNKAMLRASIQEIMTWPFNRMISSNGLIITSDAKDAFYQAFWWAFK